MPERAGHAKSGDFNDETGVAPGTVRGADESRGACPATATQDAYATVVGNPRAAASGVSVFERKISRALPAYAVNFSMTQFVKIS